MVFWLTCLVSHILDWSVAFLKPCLDYWPSSLLPFRLQLLPDSSLSTLSLSLITGLQLDFQAKLKFLLQKFILSCHWCPCTASSISCPQTARLPFSWIWGAHFHHLQGILHFSQQSFLFWKLGCGLGEKPGTGMQHLTILVRVTIMIKHHDPKQAGEECVDLAYTSISSTVHQWRKSKDRN